MSPEFPVSPEFPRTGQSEVTFYTGSNVAAAANLGIKNVYFKLTKTWKICAKADFVHLEENPRFTREDRTEHQYKKYRYNYKNLRWLTKMVDLTDLKYFTTKTKLRVDVPGACIIVDPEVE